MYPPLDKHVILNAKQDTALKAIWLKHLATHARELNVPQLESVLNVMQHVAGDQKGAYGYTYLQYGLLASEQLITALRIDHVVLLATLLSRIFQRQLLTEDAIGTCMTTQKDADDVIALLHNLRQMDALQLEEARRRHISIDAMRHMVLAMVNDIRVLWIKLSERIADLYCVDHAPTPIRQALADETMQLYAPLANRMGILALKWPLEDLAFRCLQPTAYHTIRKALSNNRVKRIAYLRGIRERLTQQLTQAGIKHFKLQHRIKHIYSIHRKMQDKKIDFARVYDRFGLRILVHTIADCYLALSAIQQNWRLIAGEFDDYIAIPKSNGYQSIHVAVMGEEDHPIEIQIRTFAIHNQSEYGGAAHWLYKEGDSDKSKHRYAIKIMRLRRLMAWQQDLGTEHVDLQHYYCKLFDDRVYVFTPKGDIKDLAKGATALDFAYAIHVDIGHRCVGAKIDGRIVPLTYSLKNGECVTILTSPHKKPSRDWLNLRQGYLYTKKAREKVRLWFRKQDALSNSIDQAQHVVRSEFSKLGLLKKRKPMADVEKSFVARVRMKGVSNVSMQLAGCCAPQCGDAIVGYITRAHEVRVHKIGCRHVKRASVSQPNRLIAVYWEGKE